VLLLGAHLGMTQSLPIPCEKVLFYRLLILNLPHLISEFLTVIELTLFGGYSIVVNAAIDDIGVDGFDFPAPVRQEGIDILKLLGSKIVADHIYLAEGDLGQLHTLIILVQLTKPLPFEVYTLYVLREDHCHVQFSHIFSIVVSSLDAQPLLIGIFDSKESLNKQTLPHQCTDIANIFGYDL
jgi:hypothetical protein